VAAKLLARTGPISRLRSAGSDPPTPSPPTSASPRSRVSSGDVWYATASFAQAIANSTTPCTSLPSRRSVGIPGQTRIREEPQRSPPVPEKTPGRCRLPHHDPRHGDLSAHNGL